MLTKVCENCGATFCKDYNRSKRDFVERAKYCSNKCKVYKQKNFYKYWKNKRRPDLVKTAAALTMFKKGVGGQCPPDKLFRKHGMTKTSFYGRWKAINQRCGNPKHKAYKDYGGRGIKNEWKSFEEYKNDMYGSYLEHRKNHDEMNTTIDRINNNGNYSKTNCRWATKAEQMMNTRRNKRVGYEI